MARRLTGNTLQGLLRSLQSREYAPTPSRSGSEEASSTEEVLEEVLTQELRRFEENGRRLTGV